MREKKVYVTWNPPGVYIIRSDNFRLIPGLNEIRQSVWDVVEKNSGVQERLKDGRMTVKGYNPVQHVEPTEPPLDEDGEQDGLSEFTVADAKEIVSECYDKETLLAWLADESRASLKKLINAQLEELKLDKDKDEE